MSQTIILLFSLFAIALSVQYSGVVLQNGFVHIVNTSEPQDSNMIYLAFSGTPLLGQINLTARGPTNFCPWGNTSCGRAVSDTTLIVDCVNQQLILKSLTNNPATVLGKVSNYQVVGTWGYDGSFSMTVSYFIAMVIPPNGITSQVPIQGTYAGSVQYVKSKPVFKGYLMAFVVPYVSIQHGGTDPYQFLVVYGAIDSSQNFSAMAGYRVYSPLGNATSLFWPPSPNAVYGSVNHLVFDGGLLRGTISLTTPVGSHVNFTNADFVSNYEFLNPSQGYFIIPQGKAIQGGIEWWLQDLKVIIQDYQPNDSFKNKPANILLLVLGLIQVWFIGMLIY